MEDRVVAIYCLCDAVLKALDQYEDSQRQMSDAEVITTAVVAALYFDGHWERARDLLSNPYDAWQKPLQPSPARD